MRERSRNDDPAASWDDFWKEVKPDHPATDQEAEMRLAYLSGWFEGIVAVLAHGRRPSAQQIDRLYRRGVEVMAAEREKLDRLVEEAAARGRAARRGDD